MKKIGILTYHHIINEGAILQAYSLYEGLKRYVAPNVEIFDYRPLNTELRYLKNNYLVKNPKRLINNIRQYHSFRSIIKKRLLLSPVKIVSNDYLKVSSAIKDKYKMIVVGSDEIWRIEKAPFARPFPNIYWLPGELGCKKISYAASANKTDYASLSDDQCDWITKVLNDFNLIGVRDNHTLKMMDHLGIRKDIPTLKVPDPTILYDHQEENVKEYLQKLGVNFNKPLLGITLFDETLSRNICEHFQSMGYQTLGLSFKNNFVDLSLHGKLHPFQWAELHRYLSFVVTNKFHGTIFSLKNKVPFLSIDESFNYGKYESKILNLLTIYQVENNYIDRNQNTTIDKKGLAQKINDILEHHNKDKIAQILESQKNMCLEFLTHVRKIFDSED